LDKKYVSIKGQLILKNVFQ